MKDPKCFIIQELAKYDPYEIAIGSNGIVWVNSNDIKYSIFLRNCIILGEKYGNDQIQLTQLIEESRKTL